MQKFVRDLGIYTLSDIPDLADQFVDPLVEGRKAAPLEFPEFNVCLKVVQCELGRERTIEPVQHLERRRGRTPCFVDEGHLLLGTDAPNPGLEKPLFEQTFERLAIPQ